MVPWHGRSAVPTCLAVGRRRGIGALAWARCCANVTGRWASAGQLCLGMDALLCQRAWPLGVGCANVPGPWALAGQWCQRAWTLGTGRAVVPWHGRGAVLTCLTVGALAWGVASASGCLRALALARSAAVRE